MADNHTQNRGFTLIEIMVTLAIAGILVAITVQIMRESIQNNRMEAQINDLQVSLSLARSEAIKRSNNMTLCRSSNGTDCTGRWHNGWIVFVDNDVDGSVDNGDEILRVHGALSNESFLTFSQTSIIYARNGIAISGTNGTFTLCDARGAADATGLIIGSTGRPRFATDSDSNGTLEDGNGRDLACL